MEKMCVLHPKNLYSTLKACISPLPGLTSTYVHGRRGTYTQKHSGTACSLQFFFYPGVIANDEGRKKTRLQGCETTEPKLGHVFNHGTRGRSEREYSSSLGARWNDGSVQTDNCTKRRVL